ncbi:MAG: septal ring lytic transglycosylase RlpA family protein [Rhodobacteraceae bacterium]|uniref:septal ring lytic transglycosylase RlpA family protein n=1 Tax=Accumulibacter sp. TaxID=2053492 RepID=UPI0019FBFF2E|nr:septal ring lytic transglycosylase RlpA family protein [Accumulibacter sp.]MBE2259005.1 septal ring lytic transglycosylase RlpA family protein [Paracoccaceae bacterium]MCB1941785.1 septal ring lytic transglycosylase RlpA family protein [Accumulibacter sp.]
MSVTDRSLSVVLSLLVVPVLLVACGGQPSRSPEGEQAKASARKSGVVQKRGGGYYKDDGPGESIPDNLDDIPEPQPKAEPLHRFANRPYVVLGKAYEPNTTVAPYQQRGVASWYGKKFHGQRTSIGEPYDMFAMTAAHPTLAIPSYVRVTNVSNGRSVVVRVIDRGPFHADRIIDLSYVAAYRLGYVDNGSAVVQVESILPEEATTMTYAQVMPAPRSPRPVSAGGRDEIELLAASLGLDTTAAPPLVSELRPIAARPSPTPPSEAATSGVSPALSGVFLQLGAFASADNAESLRSHLQRELDWLNEGIQINAGGGMHRVHMGPYRNRADAERVAERIRLALGYKPTFVTR